MADPVLPDPRRDVTQTMLRPAAGHPTEVLTGTDRPRLLSRARVTASTAEPSAGNQWMTGRWNVA